MKYALLCKVDIFVLQYQTMMLRTAQQRKTLCRSCGVAKAADLVGDSHTILIVRDLLQTPRHFCQLERSLEGISTRTLANKLKNLEKAGLVRGGADGYHLTKKGVGLGAIIAAMRAYGKKYL